MEYFDAFNRVDWQQLALLVGPGYVHHSGEQSRDLAGFIEGATWLRDGFPDLTVEVQDMLCEGDRTAVRAVLRGTHEAPLLGEEPSFRAVALDVITIYRFEDGLIAEDWEMMDEGQLRRELGL
jgi:predicted ester cyclase